MNKFFDKAKAGAADLATKAKAAAQLAAKQAEKTKIVQMTLPSAYQSLGKHLHGQGQYREDFTKSFEAIDGCLRQLGTLKATAANRTAPQGAAEKAKAMAVATKEMAESKTIQYRLNQSFVEFGKSAFEKHGEQCGPESLTRPIHECRTRVEVLDAEIANLGSVHKGQWITPKRLAIAAILVVVWGIGLVGSRMMPRTNQDRLSNNSEESPMRWSGGNSPEKSFAVSELPSRDEMTKVVYLAAATVSIKRPAGTGPSPEEFIELTHEAARQLGADKHDNTRFLTTLKPDKDVTSNHGGKEGRVLRYGSESAIFMKDIGTGKFFCVSCSVEGKDMICLGEPTPAGARNNVSVEVADAIASVTGSKPRASSQQGTAPTDEQTKAITQVMNLKGEIMLANEADGHLVSQVKFLSSWVTGADLKCLGSLPPVVELHLFQSDGVEDLHYLSGLKELTILRIEGCHKIKDDTLQNLSGLKNLRTLTIRSMPTGNAGVSQIASLSGLTYLNLSYCGQITDDALIHLKDMKGLRKLILGATQITDAGLVHLKGLTQLDTLDLSGTQVSDSGMEHLVALSNLKALDVSEAQGITDGSIGVFKRFPALVALKVTRTKITEGGVIQIQESRSQMKVER